MCVYACVCICTRTLPSYLRTSTYSSQPLFPRRTFLILILALTHALNTFFVSLIPRMFLCVCVCVYVCDSGCLIVCVSVVVIQSVLVRPFLLRLDRNLIRFLLFRNCCVSRKCVYVMCVRVCACACVRESVHLFSPPYPSLPLSLLNFSGSLSLLMLLI